MAKKITKQQIVDYWETKKCESNMGTDWDTATKACWCCGRFTDNLEKAHIVPDMLNGEYEVSNLVLLCRSCHRESPDFDNTDYMWDWIKANSESNHEVYKLKRIHKEYKKMFGEDPKQPEWIDDMLETNPTKAVNILEETAKRVWEKAGHHGGTTSYSTQACILRDTMKELNEHALSLGGIV